MEEVDVFTFAERRLSLKMMSYWSNFAKYGYAVITEFLQYTIIVFLNIFFNSDEMHTALQLKHIHKTHTQAD